MVSTTRTLAAPAQRAPRPARRVTPTTADVSLAVSPSSTGRDEAYTASVTAARATVLAYTASVLRQMATGRDRLSVPDCAALADQLSATAAALTARTEPPAVTSC